MENQEIGKHTTKVHLDSKTAVGLSIKISKMLREELNTHVDDEIFWTDSQVVLAYINSEIRRFKVFVANL